MKNRVYVSGRHICYFETGFNEIYNEIYLSESVLDKVKNVLNLHLHDKVLLQIIPNVKEYFIDAYLGINREYDTTRIVCGDFIIFMLNKNKFNESISRYNSVPIVYDVINYRTEKTFTGSDTILGTKLDRLKIINKSIVRKIKLFHILHQNNNQI